MTSIIKSNSVDLMIEARRLEAEAAGLIGLKPVPKTLVLHRAVLDNGNAEALQLVNESIELCWKVAQLNAPLAMAWAKRYASRAESRGDTRDDAMQEATLAIATAAYGFRPERGFAFSTFATWWLRSRLERTYPTSGLSKPWMVEIANKLVQCRKKGMSLQQIAESLGKTRSWISKFEQMVLSQNLISLDAPASRSGPREGEPAASMHSVLGSNDPSFDAVDLKYAMDSVLRATKLLPVRESTIIRIHYGLGRKQAGSLDDAAQVLGLTRERIRQIEVTAIRRLRRMLRNDRSDLLTVTLSKAGMKVLEELKLKGEATTLELMTKTNLSRAAVLGALNAGAKGGIVESLGATRSTRSWRFLADSKRVLRAAKADSVKDPAFKEAIIEDVDAEPLRAAPADSELKPADANVGPGADYGDIDITVDPRVLHGVDNLTPIRPRGAPTGPTGSPLAKFFEKTAKSVVDEWFSGLTEDSQETMSRHDIDALVSAIEGLSK